MKKILTFSLLLIFIFLAVTPVNVPAALIQADKVLVFKSKRLLLLLSQGEVLRAYKVALGQKPVGHKTAAGDKKTPEGTYFLDYRKSDSKFHKAIHISYPNESDALHAQKNGLSPGSDIMIHGLPNNGKDIGSLHRYDDWTDGCIAVTNSEMEEIWKLVPDGTPIEIKP